MFDKLKIKNFQSLKDVELELGHITVLCGPSNLGKSAVVRAVDCLTHNNYTEAYMRKGSQSLRVSLEEDGKSVQFNRDGKTSTYTTNFLAPLYEKIAGGVPEDISKFLNMELLTIDDLSKDLNFSFQFDGPFLLDSSGFDVGKILGRLIQLESVVGATRQISNDSASTKRDIEHTIRLISEDELYLKENAHIIQRKEMADKLRDLSSECKVKEDRLSELNHLLKRISDLSNELETVSAKINILSDIDIVDVEQFTKLQNVLSTLFDNKLYMERYKALLSKLDISTVKIENVESLSSILSSLKTHVLHLNETKVSLEKSLDRLNSAKEQFATYIKENPICPLTKKLFSKDCVDSICEVEL